MYMEYIKSVENKCSFVLVPHGEAQHCQRECLDPCLMSASYHHYLDVFTTLFVDNDNKLQPPDAKSSGENFI